MYSEMKLGDNRICGIVDSCRFDQWKCGDLFQLKENIQLGFGHQHANTWEVEH